jgi:septum formation topological specificity factor MinE
LKEKAVVSKTDVAEAKARLQVVVAEKKAHLKLDMKDLEFDRKMEWED